MKKRTKIALWTAVGCVFLGGLLMGVGSIAGGQKQLKEINNNAMGVTFDTAGLHFGNANIGLSSVSTYRGEKETQGQEVLNGDFTRSFLAADLRELDVTIGIHEFTLVTEDTDKVTVEGDHCERIQCYVKDDRLVIKDVGQKDADMNTNDRKICVTVPKDFAWTEADIDAAMASAVIEQLSGAEIELTAGMGTIEIGNIIADELNAEADMGSVIVSQFAADHLDVSADMGNVEMKGTVERFVEAEANMGSILLTLDQEYNEFNYHIETSMGSVILNKEQYKKLDQEKFINHMADKSMELEASMGSIEISCK